MYVPVLGSSDITVPRDEASGEELALLIDGWSEPDIAEISRPTRFDSRSGSAAKDDVVKS